MSTGRWVVVLVGILACVLPLRADDGFAVSGTVRDATGAPVAGAAVTVDAGATAATTDATGSFRLLLLPGRHTLRAAHPGHADLKRNVEVAGDVADLELRLEPAYRLSEQLGLRFFSHVGEVNRQTFAM